MNFGGQFLAANVTIAPTRGFDPVKNFAPIILVATGQDVLMVAPNSPFHSIKDIVDYAKAHPGEVTYASLGVGSSGHLATTLFSEVTGITLQHVPYNSFGQAVTDVGAGRISIWISTLGGSIGQIEAGKLRPIAVSGPTRAAQCPMCRRSMNSASLMETTRAGTRCSRPPQHHNRSSPRSMRTQIGYSPTRI